MKLSTLGITAIALVALGGTVALSNRAFAQQPQGGGMPPMQGMPGMSGMQGMPMQGPGMMPMPGPAPVVINDGGTIWVVEGNDVFRVSKDSVKVTGHCMLRQPMAMPMQGRGGGRIEGPGSGGGFGGGGN